MAKSAEAYVVAGGREVRVSSPERVIYEATDSTPEVTKLMVAQYFAGVEDGLMRAVRERPTAMERWPSGWRTGMRLATGPQDKGAEGFYQKRVPRGAPDHLETVGITFPSGRTAEEMCPTEVADLVWAAQMGSLTFHPWPVRRADVDRPDELRIDLDPAPGTGFSDVVRVAVVAKELLEDLGLRGFVKTSGNRGLHVFVRIEPRWEFSEVRHAAIAFGRALSQRDDQVTTAWWKEERGARIFVDYNQNTRDRTMASAWSLRPLAGAPVSMPLHWDELADGIEASRFNLFTASERHAEGDAWAEIDDVAYSLRPLLDLWESDPRELNFPPDHPKMPGEPPRVQPSKKVAEHWDAEGNRLEG